MIISSVSSRPVVVDDAQYFLVKDLSEDFLLFFKRLSYELERRAFQAGVDRAHWSDPHPFAVRFSARPSLRIGRDNTDNHASFSQFIVFRVGVLFVDRFPLKKMWLTEAGVRQGFEDHLSGYIFFEKSLLIFLESRPPVLQLAESGDKTSV